MQVLHSTFSLLFPPSPGVIYLHLIYIFALKPLAARLRPELNEHLAVVRGKVKAVFDVLPTTGLFFAVGGSCPCSSFGRALLAQRSMVYANLWW
jgi:hypothetical protein